jgi:metal-sulfur cluster biosynthetic enzyme
MIPDVRACKVDITYDPPYHPDYMSEEAKLTLGFM